MNAFDKLMHAVQAAIAKGKRPPVKRQAAPVKRQAPKRARVVSKAARHMRRKPYSPSSSELAAKQLTRLAAPQAVFTPPPEPAFDWSITAERTRAVAPLQMTGGGTPFEATSSAPTAKSQTTGGSLNVRRANCRAVDAKTGLVCKLGVHSGDVHGHERGRFNVVAAGPVRRAVDDAAWGDTG